MNIAELVTASKAYAPEPLLPYLIVHVQCILSPLPAPHLLLLAAAAAAVAWLARLAVARAQGTASAHRAAGCFILNGGRIT